MTVSHLTRTRDQLWSDLLVALGGSEAFLTRSLSDRKILLEILETYGSSVSLLTIDDVDALLAAVVNAAGGTASHLRNSKREMLVALVTALGGTPPSASSSSTGELLAACVNAAADTGGDGAPEWVPDDAKIYIDLVNDRAWTEADGEVAIDTLLGTDANTENGWAVTEYNEANLTVDGYGSDGDTNVAFIGSARTKVLSDFTLRFIYKDTAEVAQGGASFVLLAADGNDGLELDLSTGSVRRAQAISYSGSINLDITGITNVAVGAINCAAVTVAGSRFELACNGSAPSTGVIDETDRPVVNPLVAALMDGNQKKYFQSITIYDALPSTAGLSALSETGVTNTAPTITNNPADFTPSFAEAAAVNGSTVATLTTSDAEGNPLTFSLPVNVGSKFAVDATGVVTSTEDLLTGGSPYTFTLRATDPGGLYVEQEFTITVTA